MAFALKEVQDSDKNLLDIAFDYGFSSHEAFTRTFKGTYGFLHIKNYESNGYWDFWRKQNMIPGQDYETVCGLLDSIKGKLDDYMDSTMELLSGVAIDVDGINNVPELRENPLVQQAIRDIIAQFPDKEVWDVETRIRESRKQAEDFDKGCNQLAVDIDRFSKEYDPYGYRDAVRNREENISSIYRDLQRGENGDIREWIQAVIDEEEPAEDVKRAKVLLRRMDDLVERRERNPLAKVEELEEANYNQIDGILNNTKPKEPDKREEKNLSIMERLEKNREQIV